MPVPDDIIGLEEQSSSAAAYEALITRWQQGERDRESALHLLFLSWDLLMEPAHLTGRTPGTPDDELKAVFKEAHEWVLPDGARSMDLEALYVVGLVACLAPWLLGPHEEWEARSASYQARYRELLGGPISPDVFRDARGAYAEYFRDQAAVAGGY